MSACVVQFVGLETRIAFNSAKGTKHWYREFGTEYLVPSTWYQVPRTKYLVLSTWYQVLGTKFLVPSTWYQVLSAIFGYQVSGTHTYVAESSRRVGAHVK